MVACVFGSVVSVGCACCLVSPLFACTLWDGVVNAVRDFEVLGWDDGAVVGGGVVESTFFFLWLFAVRHNRGREHYDTTAVQSTVDTRRVSLFLVVVVVV